MKISLITVTWNSAKTIADTLRSVNEQTHQDLEYIVVDGGSTDTTLATVRADGRRVTMLVSERDAGIYDAMNKGLRLASGEIVGLINSDDFLAGPDVLATVATAFADPAVEAVYGDLCYVRQDDPTKVVRYWRSSPFVAGLFASGWAPPHPTLYVRKAAYERLGGFDLAYPLAADLELMVRFMQVHRIKTLYVPKVFVRMRVGGATGRLSNLIRQNREIWHALRRHGQAVSLPRFAFRKLAARLRQFTTRPAPP